MDKDPPTYCGAKILQSKNECCEKKEDMMMKMVLCQFFGDVFIQKTTKIYFDILKVLFVLVSLKIF